jgi:hypothetical protein
MRADSMAVSVVMFKVNGSIGYINKKKVLNAPFCIFRGLF